MSVRVPLRRLSGCGVVAAVSVAESLEAEAENAAIDAV
jgi:hypothetical protein